MKYDFSNNLCSHTFSEERFAIPEMLFDPTQVTNYPIAPNAANNLTNTQLQMFTSLPRMITGVLDLIGPDLRNIMANNFVLVGGVSLMRNIRPRLNEEVFKLAGFKILKPNQMPPKSTPNINALGTTTSNNNNNSAQSKIFYGANPGDFCREEIRHTSWIGGSMLGSLNQFNELWTTQSEYNETRIVANEATSTAAQGPSTTGNVAAS